MGNRGIRSRRRFPRKKKGAHSDRTRALRTGRDGRLRELVENLGYRLTYRIHRDTTTVLDCPRTKVVGTACRGADRTRTLSVNSGHYAPRWEPVSAGRSCSVSSLSVRAPAPGTLKFVVVTTTTSRSCGNTYTLLPPEPYMAKHLKSRPARWKVCSQSK